jgi:hypothetical protein
MSSYGRIGEDSVRDPAFNRTGLQVQMYDLPLSSARRRIRIKIKLSGEKLSDY